MKNIRYVLLALAVIGVGALSYILMKPKAEEGAQNAVAQAPVASVESSGELWAKRCTKEGEEYCEIFQRLAIKETGKRLLEFAIGYPKDAKGAQAVVVLPLGIVMTSGIMVQVDDQEANTAAVRSCNEEGCYALMTIPDALVDAMKAGKQLNIGFFDGAGKPFKVPMSLEGFAQKLESVR